MKDLGDLHYFLGVEAHRTAQAMHLSQHKYIHDVIHKVGMDTCKASPTPVKLKASKAPSDSNAFYNPQRYRSIEGSLRYITITRPEISYVVNTACQAMHHPTQNGFMALKQILHYLQGTKTTGLLL